MARICQRQPTATTTDHNTRRLRTFNFGGSGESGFDITETHVTTVHVTKIGMMDGWMNIGYFFCNGRWLAPPSHTVIDGASHGDSSDSL